MRSEFAASCQSYLFSYSSSKEEARRDDITTSTEGALCFVLALTLLRYWVLYRILVSFTVQDTLLYLLVTNLLTRSVAVVPIRHSHQLRGVRVRAVP